MSNNVQNGLKCCASPASHLPEILSTIGPAVDIGGRLLVWKFGMPDFLEEAWHKDVITATLAQYQPKLQQKKFKKAMSVTGAWSILAGFALQIIANWVWSSSLKCISTLT